MDSATEAAMKSPLMPTIRIKPQERTRGSEIGPVQSSISTSIILFFLIWCSLELFPLFLLTLYSRQSFLKTNKCHTMPSPTMHLTSSRRLLLVQDK